MTNRIKKVQIIRIKAYGGKLIGKLEILAELPSIEMANAAIMEWQSIGHKAQRSIIMHSVENKPNSHYGCYVWKKIFLGHESIGYDRYWCEDFWHNGEEILSERIYTNILR